MTLNLMMPRQDDLRPRITVFGVGGAGGNAVNNMIEKNLEGVEFVVANTDAQALQQINATNKIQMGVKVTEGLGAGARPAVGAAAAELGITLRWEGKGVEEVGIVAAVNAEESSLKVGQTIVKVDPRYFRPTEVETLLGDPTKAKTVLGWEPKITFEEMVAEMVRSDLDAAKRDSLIKQHGFQAFDYHE